MKNKRKFKFCPVCASKLGQKKYDKDKEVPYCQQCKKCWWPLWNVSVSGLIFNEKGEILLGKRAERAGIVGAGKWDVPGGFVDVDEDSNLFETAKREIAEELGSKFRVDWKGIVGSLEVPYGDDFVAALYYEGQGSGELNFSEEEYEDVRWFSLTGPFPEFAFPEEGILIRDFIKSRAN